MHLKVIKGGAANRKYLSDYNPHDYIIVCYGLDFPFTELMTVKDFMFKFESLRNAHNLQIFEAVRYEVDFNAAVMLGLFIDYISQDMYQDIDTDWSNEIVKDIQESDLAQLQMVLDRIKTRNPELHFQWIPGQPIKMDVVKEAKV